MRIYDIIFGILAEQLRLVSRDALLDYTGYTQDQSPLSLPEYLREFGTLTAPDEELLQRLTDSIIHAHRGDEYAAFAALGGTDHATVIFAAAVLSRAQLEVSSADRTIQATTPLSNFQGELKIEGRGRYSGGAEYARGGIGRILLVHDEQIGRDVILKELLPEHAVSPTASTLVPTTDTDTPSRPSTPIRQSASLMARFLQEAKVTGQLEHPSIVPVYELGTRADGQLYYTMKLVRGETLAAAIKNSKSEQARFGLLRPYLDVCQAMAYAHSKGVIHRDLKPSNIMVGQFGECVVLDWGLAKTGSDRDAHREALEKTLRHLELDSDDVSEQHTRDNDVLGTPLYMSPEQARGDLDMVGEHSDVYSLGVVLYEILSSKLPHKWTNSRETVHRVGTTPAPPISGVAPNTPPELAAICDKALSFDPTERYPSARELADDVRLFLEGAIVGAYAYRLQDKLLRIYREHRPLINSAAVATLAIVSMGIWSYINIYQARQAEERARIVAERERGEAEVQRDNAETARIVAEQERERATVAEHRTADEKYASEIRLAESYIREGRIQAAEDTLLGTATDRRNIEWGFLAALCNQELATFSGHEGLAHAVQYLPNGTQIFSLGGDRSARLWDVVSGASVFMWNFPSTRPRTAIIDPTGNYAAVGNFDGSIHLLNLNDGQQDVLFERNGSMVNRCNFNDDGTRLIACSSDGAVRLWDVGTKQLEREHLTFPEGVQWAGFNTARGQLLINTSTGALLNMDEQNGTVTERAESSGLVRGIEGGVILLTGERAAYTLDALTLEMLHTVGTDADIQRARLYDGGTAILIGTKDGLIRLWNGQTGQTIRTFTLGNPVSDCHRSADGSLIFAVDKKNVRTIWDIAADAPLGQTAGSRSLIASLVVTEDTSTYLTAETDGALRSWMTQGAPHRRVIEDGTGTITAVALAKTADRAAIARSDGSVHVLNTETGDYYLTVHRQPGYTGTGLCLSNDGALLGLVIDEFTSVVMNVATGEIVTRLQGHDGFILSMAFNHDASQTLTTGWDGKARLWDTRTGTLVHTFEGHENSVLSGSFSPDGRLAVTTSDDNRAIVWDLESLGEKFRIEHTARVLYAAFNPDGSAVATASGDGSVQVWETGSGTRRFETRGQVERVHTVDFSLDGTRLLTAATGGAYLWDARTGMRLASIDAALDIPRQAYFAPNGSGVIITSEQGDLTHYAGLSTTSSPSVTTRPQLETALSAYRLALRGQTPPPNDSPVSEFRFCLFDAMLQAVEHWHQKNPNASGPIPVDSSPEIHAALESIGLEKGDIVAFPESDLNAIYEKVASLDGPAVQNGGFHAYTVDIVRGDRRYPVTLLSTPPPSISHTVALKTTRARALLESCLRMLRMESDTIFEVNHERTLRILHQELDPGALRGYWILSPSNVMWRAPHAELGLLPCSRVTSVSGNTIDSLDGLISLCESGLTYLDSHDTFEVSLSVSRGMFDDVQLNLKSESVPATQAVALNQPQ